MFFPQPWQPNRTSKYLLWYKKLPLFTCQASCSFPILFISSNLALNCGHAACHKWVCKNPSSTFSVGSISNSLVDIVSQRPSIVEVTVSYCGLRVYAVWWKCLNQHSKVMRYSQWMFSSLKDLFLNWFLLFCQFCGFTYSFPLSSYSPCSSNCPLTDFCIL